MHHLHTNESYGETRVVEGHKLLFLYVDLSERKQFEELIQKVVLVGVDVQAQVYMAFLRAKNSKRATL